MALSQTFMLGQKRIKLEDKRLIVYNISNQRNDMKGAQYE